MIQQFGFKPVPEKQSQGKSPIFCAGHGVDITIWHWTLVKQIRIGRVHIYRNLKPDPLNAFKYILLKNY